MTEAPRRSGPPTDDLPDMRERGGARDGAPQMIDRRLYGQLQVFTGCGDPGALVGPVKGCGVDAALYVDVNDPRGVGIFFMSEDPAAFTGAVRTLLNGGPFAALEHRRDMTMVGRTYGIGREPDLEFALLTKPRRTALNPEWPWAVWYPLRRRPEFALLPPQEQGKILSEHAMIGMSYGKADLAHDVRLACYGLDRDDNEFVIGLVGRELTPLSRIVQDMRRTQQTAKYIQTLGPFFVGRAIFQSPMPE